MYSSYTSALGGISSPSVFKPQILDMHRCHAANHLPCLGPPDGGGKFLTRRAEGGLGPDGGPTACAAAAATAAAALEAVEAFEAADEDAGDVVVVASAAAAVADEELLLALVSNIPGGEGSIAAAHPNTLPSHRESGKQGKRTQQSGNYILGNFHPSVSLLLLAAASRALIGGWGVTACAATAYHSGGRTSLPLSPPPRSLAPPPPPVKS